MRHRRARRPHRPRCRRRPCRRRRPRRRPRRRASARRPCHRRLRPPKLTRAPRGLRTVRVGYARQHSAYCTYRRRRAARPQAATHCTRMGHAHQPRAHRTYRVPYGTPGLRPASRSLTPTLVRSAKPNPSPIPNLNPPNPIPPNPRHPPTADYGCSCLPLAQSKKTSGPS